MEDVSVSNASTPFSIHTGVWTNWSRGRVLGATLTLHRWDADLLIAFTASFIAFIGPHFWRIVCFIIHRRHSSAKARDTFHCQHQVILRNSTTAGSGLWESTKLFWTWPHTEKLRYSHILLTISTALGCVAAFTIAGGLSSRISTSVGNEVLIESTNCGINSNKDNGILDTGFMNSDNHFGINLPVTERWSWRKVLSCAPLKTSGYTSNYTDASGNYTRYHYGQHNNTVNYTYEIYDVESQYRYIYNDSAGYTWGSGHTMNANWANRTIDANKSNFEPISELRRPDGDLAIIFLSGNGVVMEGNSHDDWYRYTIPYEDALDNATSVYYLMSEAASPLGCLEQYQLCTASPEWCSPLASLSDVFERAKENAGNTAGMSPGDISSANATLQRLIWFRMVRGTILKDLNYQGSFAGIQAPLMENQWKIDLTQIWEIELAALQMAFLASTKVPDPDLSKFQVHPENQGQYDICQNLKIQSTKYGSFSLFWLIFTYGVGTLTIIVSYSLEPLLACLYRRWGYGEYGYLEWVTNGTLQLQRLANEDPESDLWSRCVEDVPVTQPGVKLGGLDSRDPRHPRFHPPQMDGCSSPGNEASCLIEHKLSSRED
ncbi:hypothetical protein F5Y13DRAFT_202643 [Hypoxylon sp. FL1857]|nr:hypothetical protein F5Y13DRAFT_202643 [Hypoxylon sp. FL1857]